MRQNLKWAHGLKNIKIPIAAAIMRSLEGRVIVLVLKALALV